MISRFFGPTKGMAVAAVAVLVLASSAAQAEGPGYSYIGASYEWTDVKYGVNPNADRRFNNGTLQGENIDFSLAITSFAHVFGQAFGYLNGTCEGCSTNTGGGSFDADMEGYKIGIGGNQSLDLIGLSENVDFVIRASFIDVEVSNLSIPGNEVSGDGWSAEAQIRGQISDRADVHIGFEYHDLDNVKNRDVTIGLNYKVVDGLSVMARGIIFDSESGFELGLRWQFGDLLFGGRDSIVDF